MKERDPLMERLWVMLANYARKAVEVLDSATPSVREAAVREGVNEMLKKVRTREEAQPPRVAAEREILDLVDEFFDGEEWRDLNKLEGE